MNTRVMSMMENGFMTKLFSFSKPKKINWESFFRSAVKKLAFRLLR